MKIKIISMALCFGIAATARVLAADAGTCTYPATGSVSIKLNDPTGIPTNAYKTSITVLGGQGTPPAPQPMVIDTGSTGIVISKAAVPDALFNQSSTLSQLFYTSSNDYLAGKTVKAVIELPINGDAKTAKTNPIDILAASCSCAINKNVAPTNTNKLDPANCASYENTAVVGGSKNDSLNKCHNTPSTVGMMGVGFDRGSEPSTANNPFLNLADVDGNPVHPGYIVTKTGISVGLTQQNTADFVKTATQLNKAEYQPKDGLPNWNAPTACVAVEGQQAGNNNPPLCGSLLVDTGIDYMFLTFDPAKRPPNSSVKTTNPFDHSVREIVTPGLSLAFTATNNNKVQMLDYKVTAAAPPANKKQVLPSNKIVGVWATPANNEGFINTGRRLLYYGNFMFDQGCGRFGFAQTTTSAH